MTFPLTPVAITVYPQPELYLDYFWQRDVYADDPWTEEIEPSIPFELAVMVWNQGGGVAQNLRIESAQPQIVENEKGLLIDFKIIASQVAGQNMTPSLNVDFGNIAPGATSIATWLMTSTLQGQFTDLSVSFTHVNGFGNPQLSLIKEVNIHQLIHTVYVDSSLIDGKPAFLVNDIPDAEDLPDTLYLPDGSVNEVFIASNAKITGTLSPSNLSVRLSFEAQPGWSYLRMTDSDPGGTLYKLVRVVRADGTEVPLQNFWQTDRTFIAGGKRPVNESNLHLLDFNCSGDYTLYYEPLDSEGPVIAELETVPNFREAPLTSLDVIFNEPIKPGTFTRNVLTLTKDGNTRNLIDETVQIEQISETHFRMIGLSAQTQEDGEYILTISLSTVEDVFGNRGMGSMTTTWLKAIDSPYIVAFV